jgi:PIN domain nuclease of toxin-antitoxin system
VVTAVADTHALIWYLYNDSRLSLRARASIETAAQYGDRIGLSSITFIEMVYLIEKGRVPSESLTIVASALNRIDGLFEEVAVNLDIARALSRVDVGQLPDMPDRIVAATALHLNVPVISRDSKIKLSNIQTIW